METTAAQLVRTVDAPRRALSVKADPRTGVLTARYPLTWDGVRSYPGAMFGLGVPEVRIAHLPEQVQAPGFLRALARLPCPVGHPARDTDRGRETLWVHADAGVGSLPKLPEGEAWVSPRDVAEGWTGDAIELVEVDGALLPVGTVGVYGPRAKSLIAAGADESSLGYQVPTIFEPGIHPRTGEEYDAYHLLDMDDPRFPADPEAGPNHTAIAIWAGRGGKMSRMLDALDSSGEGGPGFRRFELQRDVDLSGVSGTGLIAAGCCWPDGSVVLHWLTGSEGTSTFPSIEKLLETHGHQGATRIEWLDPAPTPEAQADPIEVEAEIEVSVPAPTAPAGPSEYAGGVSRLALPPTLSSLAKSADAAITLEIPDDLAAVLEPMLRELEAAVSGLQAKAASAEAQVEALAPEVAGMETMQAELDQLKTEIAAMAPKAAAMDALEADKLRETAKAHKIEIGEDAKTTDEIRGAMLRQISPKTADALIKVGPAAVEATLDAILSARSASPSAKPGLATPAEKPAKVADAAPESTPNLFAGFN